MLTAAPTIWAAHLMVCYVAASIWCAKLAGPAGSLGPVRSGIVVATVIALVAIAFIGWRGYAEQRVGVTTQPHDRDTDEDRRRFLGLATMLLAGISGVAVLYASLAAVFIARCE